MDLTNQNSGTGQVAHARQFEPEQEWSGLAMHTAALDSPTERMRLSEQLAELDLRCGALYSELRKAIEQIRAEHRQELVRLSDQLTELEHAIKDLQTGLKQVNPELACWTADLDKRQSGFYLHQKQWSNDLRQPENDMQGTEDRLHQIPLRSLEELDQPLPSQEELLAQSKLLADQQQELVSARREFDRFVSIHSNRRQGSAGIIEWNRVKYTPFRFLRWLAGPLRKLKWTRQSAQHILDPQEILTQFRLLAAKRRELEAARQKLEIERKEFDRFMAINSAQRQVLANLNRLGQEQRITYRFLHWLTGPFRKSN